MKISNLLLSIIFIVCSCRHESKAPKWIIKATYNEGCSCNAPCPCPFGLPMTNSSCLLNGLVDIHEGRYKEIDLSGVKMILSGEVGGWGEYYFSEGTSDAQKEGLEEMLKVINVTGFDTIVKSEKAEINFTHKNGKIFYSTKNIKVELKTVLGKDDKPVIVQNLNSKLFENYIPHLSILNSRSFSDSSHNFSFKKKAGFTAEWNLTNKDFENQ